MRFPPHPRYRADAIYVYRQGALRKRRSSQRGDCIRRQLRGTASLALGATPTETYFRVSVPAAKSGIAAAVVLGVGRAIGEAMAVMMVSGNVPNMPELFQSVRFLTTAVASEMSYSSGLQRQALFSIALVLFLFIMLINATLNFLLKRDKSNG